MLQYLPNCFRVEQAILQDYPFGAGRCIRRVWFEQATKGAAKGQFRMVTQTTIKSFNALYNAKIDELIPVIRAQYPAMNAVAQARKEALEWAIDTYKMPTRIAAAGTWNAPKFSIYSDLVAPYIDTENDHIGYATLFRGHGPERFNEFFVKWFRFLPDDQQLRYHQLAAESRRYNPNCWRDFDAITAKEPVLAS